ncbi:pepsin/retropepsin-like aspartic protease family protein [Dyella amyloliquefaciens]|uniref:pepsin/retropepsin-like aspartic protease family protein n=1 Tax=Dyella amyloliquefaciens TaxID=1770545 RepID=UPI00102E67AC|nr:pepsin/retropepsin-like aspartic protease family protein [Dyella amyloliquefaciens]
MKQSYLIRLSPLWLAAALALGPTHATATAVAPDADPRAALEDAAGGEVFRLEAQLPRIKDPGIALLARARIAAARMDVVEARRLVDSYLAAAERSPAECALAWPIAADASFAAGDYAKAAQASHAWQTALADAGAKPEQQADALQMATLSEQLSHALAQKVTTYAPQSMTIVHDKVGLPRGGVIINGMAQDAVLDTGANLSVVSLSTARKLKLHMLDGAASVGSSSRQAVATRIGVADHLALAGLELDHVAFLVLDDDQLSMPVPGGYHIDAIVGFPVLRELQRIQFTSDGKLVPSRSTAANVPGNMRLAGSDLYVDVTLNDLPVAMHLDSGGSHSALSSRFAREHAALFKGLASQKDHVAGAGGARDRTSVMWPHVRVHIGDQQVEINGISVSLGDAGNVKEPNVLGGDILRAFDGWTIDFRRMQFDVGAPKTQTASTREAAVR